MSTIRNPIKRQFEYKGCQVTASYRKANRWVKLWYYYINGAFVYSAYGMNDQQARDIIDERASRRAAQEDTRVPSSYRQD